MRSKLVLLTLTVALFSRGYSHPACGIGIGTDVCGFGKPGPFTFGTEIVGGRPVVTGETVVRGETFVGGRPVVTSETIVEGGRYIPGGSIVGTGPYVTGEAVVETGPFGSVIETRPGGVVVGGPRVVGGVEVVETGLPLVVRPVDLPKPVIAPPTPKPTPPPPPPAPILPPLPVPSLLPVSSPCACKTALVKPAIVPKPVCRPACGAVATTGTVQVVNQAATNQVVVNGVQTTGVVEGVVNGIVNGVTGVNGVVVNTLPVNGVATVDATFITNNPANVVPADPVSLSVAYNLAKKACQKGEEKLFFGFRQIPREIPRVEVKYQPSPTAIIKAYERIPDEGNLYQMNGEIVEFKAATAETPMKTLAEEAADDLLDLIAEEQEEAVVDDVDIALPIRKISLGEIGYAPAKLKSAKFVDIPSAVSKAVSKVASAASSIVSGSTGAVTGGVCKDGFVPGNVVVAQIPKVEPMLSRPKMETYAAPCDDSIEDSFLPVPVQPFEYKQFTTYNTNTKHRVQTSSGTLVEKVISAYKNI